MVESTRLALSVLCRSCIQGGGELSPQALSKNALKYSSLTHILSAGVKRLRDDKLNSDKTEVMIVYKNMVLEGTALPLFDEYRYSGLTKLRIRKCS